MRTTSLAVFLGVFSLSASQAFAQGLLYGQQHAKHYANSLAPYVVSPQEIVDRMLELADLKPGETLYDLGSGDGRILITAVARFKAKAVGVEISDELVDSTNARIRRLGLDNDAQVIHGNFLNVDLSPADVVTLYLATDANEMLRPKSGKVSEERRPRGVPRIRRAGLEAEVGGQGPGGARPHHLSVRNASQKEVAAGCLLSMWSAWA